MKVYIGPYKNWWNAYRISDLLQKVGVSQNRCNNIGDKLDGRRRIHDFFEWIDNKRNRKIKVRIDDFDTWSIDSTLAYIIVPLLKQLKKDKHGAPHVEDIDVPDHLKSTNSAPAYVFNEWETDVCFSSAEETDDYPFDRWAHQRHIDRWDWILDEMIWSFEQINKPFDGLQWENSETLDLTEISNKKMDDVDRHMHKYNAHQNRMKQGFLLFGKYYSMLWD